jgi:hypothetical protein
MKILEAAFTISFIIIFINATTWKGMIFNKLTKKLKNLPVFIRKPLIECPICMTPWWGTLIFLIGYFTISEFGSYSIFHWFFIVFAASGITTMLSFLGKINKKLSLIKKAINKKLS